MSCGLRHFGNSVMRLSCRHASICANFSFSFLKKVVRDQRLPTAPLFVVNISPPFGEFTAPLRHILPIHNVTTNSNNLFVNFRWTFTFCIEKSYEGTHLAFGGTLDRRCHFKRVSLKTKPVLPLWNEHGSQVRDQGRRQCCHNKHIKFPYRATRDVSLLSGHASYNVTYGRCE